MRQLDENKKFWWKPSIWAGAVLFATLTCGLALVFQDNISRFLINPRIPYQTVTPPPAPEYGERAAWALWPTTPGKGLGDIFYVHSTTAFSSDYWNAPIEDPQASALLARTAAPNEVGPFFNLGSVYAPRYRQATQFSFFTQRYDGLAAREAAFADIDRAFTEFLKHSTDEERPILLVGYGQGGLHILGLLNKHVNNDPILQKRIGAAYVIGFGVPKNFFDQSAPNFRACERPDDYRCTVSYIDFETEFDEEMRRMRQRTMVWNSNGSLVASTQVPNICHNPLDWTDTEEYLPADNHIGAASATGLKLGETPAPITRAIGAKCADGILIVDRPKQSYLRRKKWFGSKWKPQNYNLFYHDLSQNAEMRLTNTQAKLIEEATILDPITGAVEIGGSPVNKVPD